MHMFATYCLVGPLPPCLQRLRRWRRGDQGVATASDEFRLPSLFERLAHLEIVLGLEELQQCSLHASIPQLTGDVDLFLRKRIDAGVVHTRGDVEQGGTLHESR